MENGKVEEEGRTEEWSGDSACKWSIQPLEDWENLPHAPALTPLYAWSGCAEALPIPQ